MDTQTISHVTSQTQWRYIDVIVMNSDAPNVWRMGLTQTAQTGRKFLPLECSARATLLFRWASNHPDGSLEHVPVRTLSTKPLFKWANKVICLKLAGNKSPTNAMRRQCMLLKYGKNKVVSRLRCEVRSWVTMPRLVWFHSANTMLNLQDCYL